MRFLIFLFIVSKTSLLYFLFITQIITEGILLITITLIFFLKIPFYFFLFKVVLNFQKYKNIFLRLFFFICFKIIFLFVLICLVFVNIIPLIFLFHNCRHYVKFYGFLLDHSIYAISFNYIVGLISLLFLFFLFQKIKDKFKK
jgi:hypothetical protein